MSAMPAETHYPSMCRGTCPSCRQYTSFKLLGIQRWPEKVAKSANLPMEQALWLCNHCETTLMEQSFTQEYP